MTPSSSRHGAVASSASQRSFLSARRKYGGLGFQGEEIESLLLGQEIDYDAFTKSKRAHVSFDTKEVLEQKDSLVRNASNHADVNLERDYNFLSVLGVGFSLTNSWFGISAALVAGIGSGGPMLIVYGIIIMGVISTCVGICLSELASAMPTAGGQEVWARKLAPPKWSKFAGYLTGWFAWAGSVFTSASVALAMSFAILGCYQLAHPDYDYSKYHVFAVYQLMNMFAFAFNCYGHILPAISTATLWISLTSFLIILITIPSVAPTHQHPKFVFATFINNTGWDNKAIAFIVGLVNTNWAFACLDSATHMAEEVARPTRTIPLAIMGTVAIGFVTSLAFALSMFFSIVGPFERLLVTSSGGRSLTPILNLFYEALSNTGSHRIGVAIFLESLMIATGTGCLVASHTWQSRLCWSFARDGGLPQRKWLAEINHKLHVPFRAHVVSTTLVGLVGFLYLGSENAFNSMVTACIVLLYVSYSVPVACLLIKGRSNIRPGPFWMGRLGAFANFVLLGWTAFTLVMYSFPYVMPVTASTMNYVSAVYGAVTLIMSLDWWLRGRHEYHDGELDGETRGEAVLRRASSSGPRRASSSGPRRASSLGTEAAGHPYQHEYPPSPYPG